MKMSYNKTTFVMYDLENPEIWKMFKLFAMQATKYRDRYSARAIFHRIRWETMVSGKGDFKVNNNWSKYYAEKFMRLYPDHDGFFSTRRKS
jgi:hypothetical protein